MSNDQQQFDFENPDPSHWPPNERFPLNWEHFGESSSVESVIDIDIAASRDYLIITGFTSLSHLIDKFGSKTHENLKNVKIVLGWEPNRRGRRSYPLVNLEKDIRDYWLKEEEISIIHGGGNRKIDRGY